MNWSINAHYIPGIYYFQRFHYNGRFLAPAVYSQSSRYVLFATDIILATVDVCLAWLFFSPWMV